MRKLSLSELNRITVEEFKKSKKTPIIVVLDNVRSLNNIGSIFRTCDAFLTEKIILCGITAKPPHRDINKTALGATESVDWEYYDTALQAVERLKKDNITVVAVEQVDKSIMLNDIELNKKKKYALIFGNEVKGIGQDVINMSDFCVEIPQSGTKHSLNIAVSAGIVLWDFFNKLS